MDKIKVIKRSLERWYGKGRISLVVDAALGFSSPEEFEQYARDLGSATYSEFADSKEDAAEAFWELAKMENKEATLEALGL